MTTYVNGIPVPTIEIEGYRIALQANGDGTYTPVIASSGGTTLATGTPGATAPSSAVQIAGSDGTDLRTIATDTLGDVIIRPAAPKTGLWTQLAINCSNSGANIIIPGVTGQTVRVMRMFFVNSNSSTSTNVTIQDTGSLSFTGSFLMLSGGSFNGIDSNGEPLFTSEVGQGIQLNQTAAVQLSGAVWYTQS